MKIGIFSDTHLGFQPENREKEAIEQAVAALEMCIREKCDAILLPGDLFDEHIPRQETWHEAFQLFSIGRRAEKSNARVLDSKGKEIGFNGIPLIAIHGTHEFRGRDYKNALQVLESAGFIIYVHANYVVIEKGNEKIAVHGLGGVPEKQAKEVLKLYNPKPVNGMKNLLMLHQSFKEFLPFDDEMVATLSLADLPEGFYLFINVHIHFSNTVESDGRKMLLAGSTVITQMKELESTKPKLVHFLDTETMEIKSMPITVQRKFFFRKVEIDNDSPKEAVEKVKNAVEGIKLPANEIPLIKVKVKGELSKGFSKNDLDFTELKEKFAGKALLYIDVSVDGQSFMESIGELKTLHENRKSIAGMGLQLLEKNLAQTSFTGSFSAEELFSLLSEGEIDKAVDMLAEN